MSDPLPPLPRPVSYTSGYANFSETQVIGYATAYATAATTALRQRVAELEQLLKVMERQYADALERFQKMHRENLEFPHPPASKAWWSSGEVQEWLDELPPLYRFPIGDK
jgi:hypothetical protein